MLISCNTLNSLSTGMFVPYRRGWLVEPREENIAVPQVTICGNKSRSPIFSYPYFDNISCWISVAVFALLNSESPRCIIFRIECYARVRAHYKVVSH